MSAKFESPPISINKPSPMGQSNPFLRALYFHFQRADALATHYTQVHRSGFVLIYLLGPLSLAAASTAQFSCSFIGARRTNLIRRELDRIVFAVGYPCNGMGRTALAMARALAGLSFARRIAA
jgi:hypothetical protein